VPWNGVNLPAATGFYHRAESDETPLTCAANAETIEWSLVGTGCCPSVP